MECLQSRIDSFTKPKRVKNPNKQSSFVSVKWLHPPHPRFIATPETLAEAGFYFNPSFEDRDNVACFVCDKQLSDWEADDDPFDIHWTKCGDKCCWAIVRCGLRSDINRHGGFTFTDKSRVPTSKAMEQARLDTFSAGDGWIHDQVKNHGANSRKMARAGFVFTPQQSGDDLATCLYCNVALSGWEASDDPLEEHRKRRKGSCPMFDAGETATKPPSRTPSAKAPSKSQTSKPIRAASPPSDTDFVQPLKTHDGDADGSNPAPPPSSKRIRTLPSSSKSTKTPKVSRSQSRSELQDVVEGDEDMETEAEVPRTGRGKAKKSIGTAMKKAKSRSKSVVPRITSDDEEEVISKAPSRSRSKAKGKEKAVVDDDEPEEDIKVLKKSTRGRPPSRVKESEEGEHVKVLKKSTRGRAPPHVEESGNEEEEQDVKIAKKSTRGRAPPRVEESENEGEDEEQDVKVVKKSNKGRVPSRVKEQENDDEDVTKTVKKPTRTKSSSMVEGKTTARKPSSARTSATKADSKVAKPDSKRASRASGRTTPAPPRDVNDGDADELSLPPLETRKRAPSSSASNKPVAPERKAKEKAPVPGSPPPEKAVDNEDEDDDMDVFVSPRESPEPHVEEEEIPDLDAKVSEVDEEFEPLVIPKRTAKLSLKPSTKPTKAMDDDVDMESVSTSRKSVGQTKPQVHAKENTTKPTRESQSEIRSRKGSFLKVVEISTDEEGGASDEEQPLQKNKKKLAQMTELQPTDAPSSELEKTAEKPTVVVEPPPPPPPVEPTPSRKATPPPPSTPPLPVKPSEDIEMVVPEPEPKQEPLVEPRPTESVVEVPVPQTPSRASAPTKAPSPEPPLFIPALSKLPFKHVQSLTDAELDMTVEEWIRYQMEMEYDKFKRDGEREIGRFKRKAEEVREVIERL
ncbi:hypothetical protein C0992_009285 [Termitomyces sp. T32_za158]|nr:hypothetical protein C0992_009285 [Termitomyces sp. T32_za158]